jgi:GTP1/Obg family GTP-binding protein
MSYKPVFIALLSITLLGAVQTTPSGSSQASSSQAGAANAAENAQIRQLANARANDAQALRDDIKRMRALVGQMESNLAFVDTTQSPLKHQFQLDIDMWNVVINQMERRAYPNSR